MHRRRRRCSRRRRRIRSFSRKFWKARLSPGPGSAGGPRPRCAGLTRAASTHPRRGRVALRLPKGTPWRRSGAEGALHAESTCGWDAGWAGHVPSGQCNPAAGWAGASTGDRGRTCWAAARTGLSAGGDNRRMQPEYRVAPVDRRRSTAKVVLEVRPAQVTGAGLESSRAATHRVGRVAGSLGSRGAKTWRPRRGRGSLKK